MGDCTLGRCSPATVCRVRWLLQYACSGVYARTPDLLLRHQHPPVGEVLFKVRTEVLCFSLCDTHVLQVIPPSPVAPALGTKVSHCGIGSQLGNQVSVEASGGESVVHPHTCDVSAATVGTVGRHCPCHCCDSCPAHCHAHHWCHAHCCRCHSAALAALTPTPCAWARRSGRGHRCCSRHHSPACPLTVCTTRGCRRARVMTHDCHAHHWCRAHAAPRQTNRQGRSASLHDTPTRQRGGHGIECTATKIYAALADAMEDVPSSRRHTQHWLMQWHMHPLSCIAPPVVEHCVSHSASAWFTTVGSGLIRLFLRSQDGRKRWFSGWD